MKDTTDRLVRAVDAAVPSSLTLVPLVFPRLEDPRKLFDPTELAWLRPLRGTARHAELVDIRQEDREVAVSEPVVLHSRGQVGRSGHTRVEERSDCLGQLAVIEQQLLGFVEVPPSFLQGDRGGEQDVVDLNLILDPGCHARVCVEGGEEQPIRVGRPVPHEERLRPLLVFSRETAQHDLPTREVGRVPREQLRMECRPPGFRHLGQELGDGLGSSDDHGVDVVLEEHGLGMMVLRLGPGACEAGSIMPCPVHVVHEGLGARHVDEVIRPHRLGGRQVEDHRVRALRQVPHLVLVPEDVNVAVLRVRRITHVPDGQGDACRLEENAHGVLLSELVELCLELFSLWEIHRLKLITISENVFYVK